jgi:hypothetical protein
MSVMAVDGIVSLYLADFQLVGAAAASHNPFTAGSSLTIACVLQSTA